MSKQRRGVSIAVLERKAITPSKEVQSFALVVTLLDSMYPSEREKALKQSALWFGYRLYGRNGNEI